MGCDIHAVIQVKKADGKWVVSDWDPLKTPRQYSSFAIMAGVRNHFQHPLIPICEPKGLPEDIGFIHGEEDEHKWLGDHSFSWLTLKELREWKYWGELIPNYDGKNYFQSCWAGAQLQYWMEEIAGFESVNEEDIRIVFGFDN